MYTKILPVAKHRTKRSGTDMLRCTETKTHQVSGITYPWHRFCSGKQHCMPALGNDSLQEVLSMC